MKKVVFSVRGIAPGLLMNNPESMGGGDGGGVSRKKIPSPEDEAAAKVYKDEDEHLFVPAIWFRSCLISGGKGRKIGKSFATSLLKGTVFLIHERCPLADPDTGELLTDYEIDVRRCVVQNQGVRRARPKIPNWATEISFEYDDEALTPKVLEEVFAIAGKRIGVGDYRPEKGGPFGRFEVLGWAEVE